MLAIMSYFEQRNIPFWQVILTSTARPFERKGPEVLGQAINPHLLNSAGDFLSSSFCREKK
jgi:hypothetical protein